MGRGGITWTSLPPLPSGIFLPGSPPFGAGIGSAFGAGAGAAAVVPQDEQLSQQSLWRNLFSKRLHKPSSQPQSPQPELQLVQLGAGQQESQQLDE